MSDQFQFDIDKIASSTLSKTDPTTEIITEDSNDNPKAISFFDRLTPEQQSAIKERIPALVDQFLDDQNSLLDFGQAAVEEVNTTVNHILAEQKKIQIPQVDDLLKNTNKELHGFIAKYKNASPAELEKNQISFKNYLSRVKQVCKSFILIPSPLNKKWTAWQLLLSSKKRL